MATTQWRDESFVINELMSEPYNFEFFQAVRLLHYYFRNRVPVGLQTNNDVGFLPSNEVVNFKVPVSLAFQPSDIVTINLNDEKHNVNPDVYPTDRFLIKPPEMIVSFIGLTGPQGVLPNVYTEYLYERNYKQDYALRDFLDIFNHRLISLYYRAWQKYRITSSAYTLNDNFNRCIYSIIGSEFDSIKSNFSFELSKLVEYAGIIARKPITAETIENILGTYFSIKVSLKQFVGQWLLLDSSSLSRLEASNPTLAINAVIGDTFYDLQSKFLLIFGPLTYAEYVMFLPNGSQFTTMIQLVNFLAGCEQDYEVQMLLKAEEVPYLVLSQSAQDKSRLGWNTWLKTETGCQDDSQYVYHSQM